MIRLNQVGRPIIDDNIDNINRKILDSILDDDDEQFSQLVSQIIDLNSSTDHPFQLSSYKLPKILSSSPSYACLCAFFSSKKCFESLTNLIPDGLNSYYFKKCDKNGRSLVHFACAGGNLEIIRELEQANYELDVYDKWAKYPSNYSAMFGRTDVIKYLWTKGVDIVQVKSSMSPIHEACEYGNLEIVKFICEKVDDLILYKSFYNIEKNRRGNSLHLACQGGHSNIVEYILSNKKMATKLIKEYDGESKSPIICACENGSLECVKLLVQFGFVEFNNNHRKRLPLIEAAANGHSDIVKYLLKQKNCDINAMNSNKLNAIEAAVINGHFDVVEILINNGAIKDFNENDIGNLFLDACGTFNIEMIKFLDKILNIPYKTMGEKFMKQAVKIENENLVNFLLEKNCELNNNACSTINFKAKWTPFMTFLKEKGADFSNMRLSDGNLLIVHSINECASLNTVKQLISEGVSLNEQIISENNLLYIVGSMARAELFDFLSSFKPKFNFANECFHSVESRMFDMSYHQNYQNSKYYKDCLKIAESLLRDYNVDPNDSKNVSYAFTHSLIDILELLSRYNSDFSNIRINCSEWFYDYDSDLFGENLEFLKDKNVDINKILSDESNPIIVEAIKALKVDIIKDLISKGFELNSDIISQFELVHETIFHRDTELFNFLLSYNPSIKNIKSCILILCWQYCESESHNKYNEMKDCIEKITTLFTQYDLDPNNEIIINIAVFYKLTEIIDLLAKFGADFNGCYIDYSNLVSHEYLKVFSCLKKNGCLFQKAKITHLDFYILPFCYKDEEKVDLFEGANEMSPIQENINSFNRSDYDINSLLFLLKYSNNDDIINFSFEDKNIIDILLKYECFDDIVGIFTKLDKILLPNHCDVEEFKELIAKNVNMIRLTDEAKLLIDSFIK